MTTNRYPGTCNRCFRSVAAGEGVYDYGNVYHHDDDADCARIVDRLRERERHAAAVHAEFCRALSNPDYVPTIPEAVERVAEYRAEKAAEAASPAGQRRAKAETERRARHAAEDARWAAQGRKRCDRCGGAGGAAQWPGFTCYDCGGHGSVVAE